MRGLALRLMALVVISLFASALELSIYFQEVLTVAWRGSAAAPHFGLAGWATPAIEAAVFPILFITFGYRSAGRRLRASWRAPHTLDVALGVSAALAILGMVVYSQMVPVSEIRIPDDLKSRAFLSLFTFVPEEIAAIIAMMGFGGGVRVLLEPQ